MVERNRLFGCDMRKWYITKHAGWWTVCPPHDGTPGWSSKGAVFKTGAEALAAFSQGGLVSRPIIFDTMISGDPWDLEIQRYMDRIAAAESKDQLSTLWREAKHAELLNVGLADTGTVNETILAKVEALDLDAARDAEETSPAAGIATEPAVAAP